MGRRRSEGCRDAEGYPCRQRPSSPRPSSPSLPPARREKREKSEDDFTESDQPNSDPLFLLYCRQEEPERYHQTMRVPSKGALVRAKRLRRILTPSEEAIWEHLRDRKLLGLKFRRQVPVGPYVADFYCYELRLVLELDGSIHEEASQISHDVTRDANLEALGFRVLRFTNQEATDNPETLLDTIRRLYLRRTS